VSSANENDVLGQKYAFATASLLLGLACYVNLLGMEKGLLAILFGWMALRASPPPALTSGRRAWAKVGVALGSLLVILVPTVLVVFHGRMAALLEAISRLP